MKFNLTGILLLACIITWSQFSDDFSDGDFHIDPNWSGDVSNFEVDGNLVLHLNAPAVADISYLSLPSIIMNDVTWDFWLKLGFNPSSTNYARIYIVADKANLKGPLNGYFVHVGNTSDEISLYKQTGLLTTKIIDGVDGSVNMASVNARIKVTRDGVGNWELFRDTTGGMTYLTEGMVFDDTHTTTTHFGVYCNYTATRSTLFYFDEIGTPYIDNIAPIIEDVVAISDTEVTILFSEEVDESTATMLLNYTINLGIGNPVSVVVDITNPSRLNLSFGTAFENGTTYTLTTSNVEDLVGNVLLSPSVTDFLYFEPAIPAFNDVILSEIFPDPSPVIGLPEVEFFEIYNRTNKFFDLDKWTVNDNTSEAKFSPYILRPDEYVVICGIGNGVLFGIDNVLELEGLPTLTNAQDYLVLKSQSGEVIDSVHYFLSWYKDNVKKDGGWTLERKHVDTPCSDEHNWAASIDISGGTPGKKNSLWTDMDDVIPPVVMSFELLATDHLMILFNERMDTSIAPMINLFPTVEAVSSSFTDVNTLLIQLQTLSANINYALIINKAADCWGNEMNETIYFAVPDVIEPEDILVNEVLFDPKTGGSDYVELYNNSAKILNLQNLLIGSWAKDKIGNLKALAVKQAFLLPGEYVVLTKDSTQVIKDFPIYGAGRFLKVDLPSYPNDSGTVYLLTKDAVLIDYFQYEAKFHYPLITNVDGKALERISFGGGMNNRDYWHTASESVDWGTPGYLNSQYLMPKSIGEVSLHAQIFSPDNDGFQDVLAINLELHGIDNLVDIDIYDNQGRHIRELKDNFFVGQNEVVFWDGINKEGAKAAIGTYIILVRVQTVTGEHNTFKLVAVLAGHL